MDRIGGIGVGIAVGWNIAILGPIATRLSHVYGVSLTVAGLDGDTLTVALIPATREATTLGEAAVGRRLNVEVDILAKHVERLVVR